MDVARDAVVETCGSTAIWLGGRSGNVQGNYACVRRKIALCVVFVPVAQYMMPKIVSLDIHPTVHPPLIREAFLICYSQAHYVQF
jgi:hypothetical protein